MNYYNEFDPFAADWLRGLIDAGKIPAGHVDGRDIREVTADDLRGYVQCHFFAGIGGWPLALHLAGWPATEPVWTGSCPCQPFSSAGKRQGTADERHLWPEFRRILEDCRPAVVFGEQVASPDGRLWLAGVHADLEALGYAVGAADLPAAGVAAPHRRYRLFWVADSSILRLPREDGSVQFVQRSEPNSVMGDAHRERQPRRTQPDCQEGECKQQAPRRRGSGGSSFWSDYDIVECREPDGVSKFRRVEPGAFPLADGLPGRVGLLRGYGNAIVPQVAAEFIAAFMETKQESERCSA